MAKDWLADVRIHDADADENVVAAIVRYCGIALRSENASKVTFSKPEETDRVRDNFLKKKLGRTEADPALDAAIQSVGASMGGGTQNRVSLYYLLTRHFDMLSVFGGGAAAVASVAAAAPVAAAPAVPAASDTTIATAVTSGSGHSPTRPTGSGGGGGGSHSSRPSEGGDDFWGIAAFAGIVMLGAIVFAALVSVWAKNTVLTADPVEETAAAAPAEMTPAAEPAEEAAPPAP